MMTKEPIGFNTASRSKKAPLDPIKEVRKIQRRLPVITKVLGQLDSRIEELEVLEVQEQLNSLATQVKALRQDFLEARRTFATIGLFNSVATFEVMCGLLDTPATKALLGYLLGMYTEASKRLQETADPERVTREVYATIIDRLKTLRAK